MGRQDVEKKAAKAIKILHGIYAGQGTALRFSSVFQLAIAVILSAQCTDQRVNIVTKELFMKLRTPKDFAGASQGNLKKLVYSTGFYRAKARNLRAMAKAVLEKYGGKMPCTMSELVALPGIGRKTANIILCEGFGITEGIAVDTHVKRLANRLGFTKSRNPEIIERELMEILPKKEWANVTNLLIWHGRRVCTARKPDCMGCALNRICPNAFRV